ncbi:MAG: class I SAM-dependent methyltransferase [Acidobacteriota bacterium]|nr:class I SAM-dependent methyltransferase [Acidobacteriota bacterium]
MAEPVASTAPPIERAAKEKRYRDFWADIGDGFPDLGGAASTDLYLRDEQALFEEFLPDLEGKTVFKTDLWDEARNTRILRWVAAQGASTFGIDISLPIVRRARQQYGIEGLRLGSVVSDVRTIPYRSDCFDALYSMGTVEHFEETAEALAEIHRVVKPGGRAIIGVPNRWDPFLRPILVALLYFVGKYDYGFEKCYSRREFAQMLQDAGFRVVGESGILFIPGWLRILDLACHAWAPALTAVTAPAVGLFARLSKRFPWLRRHGYLLATVVEKPR